ncbi:hypothetical protein V8C86DRAFT_65990 [Haematococcus lacustris]
MSVAGAIGRFEGTHNQFEAGDAHGKHRLGSGTVQPYLTLPHDVEATNRTSSSLHHCILGMNPTKSSCQPSAQPQYHYHPFAMLMVNPYPKMLLLSLTFFTGTDRYRQAARPMNSTMPKETAGRQRAPWLETVMGCWIPDCVRQPPQASPSLDSPMLAQPTLAGANDTPDAQASVATAPSQGPTIQSQDPPHPNPPFIPLHAPAIAETVLPQPEAQQGQQPDSDQPAQHLDDCSEDTSVHSEDTPNSSTPADTRLSADALEPLEREDATSAANTTPLKPTVTFLGDNDTDDVHTSDLAPGSALLSPTRMRMSSAREWTQVIATASAVVAAGRRPAGVGKGTTLRSVASPPHPTSATKTITGLPRVALLGVAQGQLARHGSQSLRGHQTPDKSCSSALRSGVQSGRARMSRDSNAGTPHWTPARVVSGGTFPAAVKYPAHITSPPSPSPPPSAGALSPRARPPVSHPSPFKLGSPPAPNAWSPSHQPRVSTSPSRRVAPGLTRTPSLSPTLHASESQALRSGSKGGAVEVVSPRSPTHNSSRRQAGSLSPRGLSYELQGSQPGTEGELVADAAGELQASGTQQQQPRSTATKPYPLDAGFQLLTIGPTSPPSRMPPGAVTSLFAASPYQDHPRPLTAQQLLDAIDERLQGSQLKSHDPEQDSKPGAAHAVCEGQLATSFVVHSSSSRAMQPANAPHPSPMSAYKPAEGAASHRGISTLTLRLSALLEEAGGSQDTEDQVKQAPVLPTTATVSSFSIAQLMATPPGPALGPATFDSVCLPGPSATHNLDHKRAQDADDDTMPGAKPYVPNSRFSPDPAAAVGPSATHTQQPSSRSQPLPPPTSPPGPTSEAANAQVAATEGVAAGADRITQIGTRFLRPLLTHWAIPTRGQPSASVPGAVTFAGHSAHGSLATGKGGHPSGTPLTNRGLGDVPGDLVRRNSLPAPSHDARPSCSALVTPHDQAPVRGLHWQPSPVQGSPADPAPEPSSGSQTTGLGGLARRILHSIHRRTSRTSAPASAHDIMRSHNNIGIGQNSPSQAASPTTQVRPDPDWPGQHLEELPTAPAPGNAHDAMVLEQGTGSSMYPPAVLAPMAFRASQPAAANKEPDPVEQVQQLGGAQQHLPGVSESPPPQDELSSWHTAISTLNTSSSVGSRAAPASSGNALSSDIQPPPPTRPIANAGDGKAAADPGLAALEAAADVAAAAAATASPMRGAHPSSVARAPGPGAADYSTWPHRPFSSSIPGSLRTSGAAAPVPSGSGVQLEGRRHMQSESSSPHTPTRPAPGTDHIGGVMPSAGVGRSMQSPAHQLRVSLDARTSHHMHC